MSQSGVIALHCVSQIPQYTTQMLKDTTKQISQLLKSVSARCHAHERKSRKLLRRSEGILGDYSQ